MNVADYLLSDKNSKDIALMPLSGACSFGELTEALSRGADRLAGAGFSPGDRVLLIAENSVFWVTSYLSILRAGLVAVPLPPTIAPNDLKYVIETTEPRLVLCDAKVAQKYCSEFVSLQVATELSKVGAKTLSTCPELSGDDLAALMFTSGSTGRPRGVMVSHRNIAANTDSIIASMDLSGADRIMAVLPFHYCFGTSLLHTHLRVGGSLVLDNRFLFPETVLQRMRETCCTGFAGVPSHYQILLRKSTIRHQDFPHLRRLQQAGGHLAPHFVRELREAVPRANVYIMYGQTEATARLALMPPDMLDSKPGSIGKAIPGVTLTLRDESGEAVPRGEIGEIVAEGDNITKGYWRDEMQSAKVFSYGRLHTGDLARMDSDRFLYIVDRAKDFLKCGGKRVSCCELEDAIAEFEEVLEAAVIGVPDEILGEAVKAFVVPRTAKQDGLEEKLRLFCKKRIPGVCQPKEIVLLKTLPKSSSGKVYKPALREYGVHSL